MTKREGATARTLELPESRKVCSMCWFVLSLYPALQGMHDRDSAVFRIHLRREHGLREEIQP